MDRCSDLSLPHEIWLSVGAAVTRICLVVAHARILKFLKDAEMNTTVSGFQIAPSASTHSEWGYLPAIAITHGPADAETVYTQPLQGFGTFATIDEATSVAAKQIVESITLDAEGFPSIVKLLDS